jgi:hypothetical protein
MSVNDSPHSSATAAAASAFPTWWRPCSRSITLALPPEVTRTKVGRPLASSMTSSARTSASGLSPTRTTRACVRAAIAATTGSSALRTATPSAGNAWTNSALARAMLSRPPNSPTWADPTLSTTPIRGGAIRVR